MYGEDGIVREGVGIGVFRNVLLDEFVGVLGEAFLPEGIGVCEIGLSVLHFGDVLVFGELGAVVGCDGENMVFDGFKQLHNNLGNDICVHHRGAVVDVQTVLYREMQVH